MIGEADKKRQLTRYCASQVVQCELVSIVLSEFQDFQALAILSHKLCLEECCKPAHTNLRGSWLLSNLHDCMHSQSQQWPVCIICAN